MKNENGGYGINGTRGMKKDVGVVTPIANK
jgi:hypothetical protein